MLTSFDLMLVATAFVIMFSGFSRRWSAWRGGRAEERRKDLKGVLEYILGHGKILQKRKPGIAHLMLFWGFVIPLIVIVFAQFKFGIPLFLSRILSLLMDIIGIGLLTGTLFFLVRRLRAHESGGPKRTVFPMALLLAVLTSGFLAEGSRLSITNPQFSWATPFGWIVSLGLPASPVLMQVMIRIHFLGVLLFIACLPFTFMRHLAAAPLNILYKRKGSPGVLRKTDLNEETVGTYSVADFTWKQLLEAEACVSCGRCEENCPAFLTGKPLSPRKIIQDLVTQMESASRNGGVKELLTTGDEIWACTTCMACVQHCPVFVETMDKIIDMRRYEVMGKGAIPSVAKSMIRNLEVFGDVQGKGGSYRADWAFNLSVPSADSAHFELEILLWVGCSGSFHPRYQDVSRAMVRILKTAAVPFYILGKNELCCGDPARRLGEESLFLMLARKNIQRLRKYHVTKIVTLCPHCFNTLKNEYPEIDNENGTPNDAPWEVQHASEYVMDLIREKRISLKYPLSKRVTIHDSCYLGRGNNLYDPPRGIIKAVPGTRFLELKRHHEAGFCCGGGGGCMWLHEQAGRRMNNIRAEEVVNSGADLAATACPYCLTMLDDGISSLEMERPPRVLDIIEIVASSIG